MNINRDTYIQTMGLQWEIWRQMCLFFSLKPRSIAHWQSLPHWNRRYFKPIYFQLMVHLVSQILNLSWTNYGILSKLCNY